MQNLTVIENELVPVYETSAGEKVVYGSELHEVLEVKTPYKDWSVRRLKDCDAVENEDFEAAQICAPSGQTKKDHIIKLDTAKEMAMLERNEKGKQVRRYFIKVEKKYKAGSMVTTELSPELQMFSKIFESAAKLELKQKEQDKKLEQLDNKVDSIKEVVALRPNAWRKETSAIINKIAFSLGGAEHIKVIREESYKTLEERMHVALNRRLANKKKTNALNGMCKSKLDKLNQLDVIADDPKLIEGYIAIIKEMAVKYGISAGGVA